MKRSSNVFWGVLIALLIFVAAISIEVFTVGMFLKGKEAETWPTTQGTILKSELTSEFQGSTNHEARIEYEYRVGDKQYQSKQVRTRGTSTKHKSDVAPLVEKYPVGKEVSVYYNTANPAEAYLEPGVDVINYVIIVSPLIFVFGAGAYLVEMFRAKKSSGTKEHAE